MKRLGMIAVTGILTMALGACGGNDAPPAPEAGTDNMMNAPMQQPAQATTPAAPGTESEAVTATPAPENAAPAPADAAPTADQMTGATAEE